MNLETKATLSGVAASSFTLLGVSGSVTSGNDHNSYSAVPLTKIKSSKFTFKEVDAPSYKNSPKKVEHKFDSIFTDTNTDAKSNDKIIAKNTKIKNNLDNFVDPMGNQDWWNKAYETRAKHLKFLEEFNTLNLGYADLTENARSLNKICYYSITSENVSSDEFLAICTKNGKGLNGKEFEVKAKTAKFPIKDNTEKEITYATIDQYKRYTDPGYYENVKDRESSFVSSWANKEWWEWSFEYRLEVDKNNEKSPFPRSRLFKTISKGWEWNTNENALNIGCRELYKKPGIFNIEREDMWRYCSDIGKNTSESNAQK